MLRPEPLDLLIIVVVAILLFGANRLPDVARGFGGMFREFKNAITEKDGEKPKTD